MSKHFLYIKREHLAKRSQNLIDELGGIENLINFYIKHNSFLNLPSAGRYTNEQLSSYCEYLLSRGSETEVTDVNTEITSPPVRELKIDLIQCLNNYSSEKPFLSNRLKNILAKIELQNNFEDSSDKKFDYLRKYFLRKYNFLNIQNLGRKTHEELEEFRDKITDGENYFVIPEIVEYPHSPEHEKKNSILNLSEREIEECFDKETEPCLKILCYALLNNDLIRRKHKQIMLLKYFSTANPDNKQLADILNLTPERIRQLTLPLNRNLLPGALKILIAEIRKLRGGSLSDYSKHLVWQNDIEHFTYKESLYTPNHEFSKLYYQEFYTGYELIDNLITENHRSFAVPQTNLFVAKKFISDTQLIALLDWADEQIYSFEIISFDYRLDILIERYYKEHDLIIGKQDLIDLTIALKEIKKENIEIDQNILKKLNKKSLKESILNEVYHFIKEKNEGQSTKSILEHLNQNNLEVKKHMLLKYLKDHSTTFSFLGMGNWTLKEWNKNEDFTPGNFRQLIRNLLLKNDDPLHISEILAYINTMKKVSLHSLSGNLKLETEGTFIFFNCSFIGLSEKTYNAYWQNIPKFNSTHFSSRLILNEPTENLKWVKDFAAKSGFPERHLLFLLEKKFDEKYID